MGSQVPLKPSWNLDLLESLLADYHDQDLLQWMRHGWPVSRLPTLQDPTVNNKNNKGAEDYPEALEKYIRMGLENRHIIGPFRSNPFSHRTGTSPLSTVSKRNSQKCRIIVNLSYPLGRSVNDMVWYS